MKQIIQHLKTGETELAEVPAPLCRSGHVLIRTTRTLVSLGTERMLVEFGKANLIAKAQKEPDRVKQVLQKMRTDGIMPTLEAVFNKLDTPLPLGYCNVGRVMEVGNGVSGFQVGDRVVSNGQHAEFVCVPQNLVAKIPDGVSDDQAVFTVISSIGLQGLRLLKPTFGETVCVFGLGLIGQVTAQLLIANGCRVIGIDLDPQKLEMAQSFGVIPLNGAKQDVVSSALDLTDQAGVDGVIITASAKGDSIVQQAANMSRKRGRIILVGVVNLNLDRADFYEKELSFQVSCSYGPGRYDYNYENKGQDYPLPYVRWTEKRNFEAVLQALSDQNLKVDGLISQSVLLKDYQEIYGNMRQEGSIASLIRFPEEESNSPDRVVSIVEANFSGGKTMGIIGAGNFTRMAVLPMLKKAKAPVKYLSSAGGVSAATLARKYSVAKGTTDINEILNDPEVGLVLITTRHNQHASMVADSLKAGKDVFVEKPLAIYQEELEEVVAAQTASGNSVTVGFNRRFSPHSEKVKSLLDPTAPKTLIATMNAGFIPQDVWVHDRQIGGGRIIGEACHMIDLLVFLSGSQVEAVCMNAMGSEPDETTDNASILLRFKNGDQGIVNYFSNGNKGYAKERVEAHSQGKTLIIDNFRRTKGYGVKGFSSMRTKLDKGHQKQFSLLSERLKNGGEALIPFEDVLNVSRASLAAVESMVTGNWIEIE